LNSLQKGMEILSSLEINLESAVQHSSSKRKLKYLSRSRGLVQRDITIETKNEGLVRIIPFARKNKQPKSTKEVNIVEEESGEDIENDLLGDVQFKIEVKNEPENVFVVAPKEEPLDWLSHDGDRSETDSNDGNYSDDHGDEWQPSRKAKKPKKNGTATDSGDFYKCDQCDKSYRSKSRLIIHQRSHTGEKPFMCSYCSRTFTSREYQMIHERRLHGDKSKPYSCTTCDKTYEDKFQLDIHMRSHTGERPFKCGYCPKRFTSNASKTGHEMRVHGDSPYSCEICKKTFARPYELKNHMKKHEDDDLDD